MATLVIEDGTGVIDANSYMTVQDFKDYFDCIGADVSGITDDQITAGLIDAGSNLLEYCYSYKGEISFPETPQALSFPREGLKDRNGCEIEKTQIPGEVIKAQAELARSSALAIIAGGRIAFSDQPVNTGAVKKNKLDVMEQEYYGPGTEVQTTVSKTVDDFVRKLLEPFLDGGSNPFQLKNVAVS